MSVTFTVITRNLLGSTMPWPEEPTVRTETMPPPNINAQDYATVMSRRLLPTQTLQVTLRYDDGTYL